MCAFNSTLDFGKDMIKLGASTLGRLIEIQLEDFATFIEHQSAAMYKAAGVRDVDALLALRRDYQNGFWKDRLDALVAARKTLQAATESVGQTWSELMSDADSPVARPRLKSPDKSEPTPSRGSRKRATTRSKELIKATAQSVAVPAVATVAEPDQPAEQRRSRSGSKKRKRTQSAKD